MPETDQYNKLLEQRRAEASSRALAKISLDFYETTSAYLMDLRGRLTLEIRENPTSRKVELTRQVYQRAVTHARDVVDFRLAKIAARAAQQATVGGEPPAMLPIERALFDALVKSLAECRGRLTPFLDAKLPVPSATPATPENAPGAGPPPPPNVPSPPPVLSGTPGSAASPMVTVRILRDGPPIEVARGDAVELRKEDVLTLPEGTAELLIRGKAAEKIEGPARSSPS